MKTSPPPAALLSIIFILATAGLAQTPPPPPPAPLPIPKDAVNVSGGVLQASAIKKVEPVYPPIARAMKAEGEVRIHVTVSEDGKVIGAEAIEAHPLLRDAALQAARQWELKPTELSGKSVKVVGVLTFNFSLK
jgi:protein TonB